MTEAEHEKARQAAKDRAKRAQQRKDDAFRWVMSSPLGRDFVARCIYEFGALKSTSVHSDPHLRDIHQGQRAVGAAIEREAHRVGAAEWQLMENERTDRLRLEPSPVPPPDDEDD